MVVKPSSSLLNDNSGVPSMDIEAHERCEQLNVRALQAEAERLRGVKDHEHFESTGKVGYSVGRDFAEGGEMDG